MQSPSVVVEIGQAHEGSESLAHAYIDAVASTGADAIKFQLHIADVESSLDDVFRSGGAWRRESRFEYWKRTELRPEVIGDLIAHAHEKSLAIGFSTFSLEGLDFLGESDMDFLKIGSGEAIQSWFLREARNLNLPIVLSTGLSTLDEIGDGLRTLSKPHRTVTVLQCTSSYPSKPEDIGLNLLRELAAEFGLPVGLSDHSGNPFAGLAALADGAEMLEIHATFSRQTQALDADSSLDIQEVGFLCQFRDHVRLFRENPVDKDLKATELKPMRQIFGRSLASKVNLLPGETIRSADIYFAKPGGGIPPGLADTYDGAVLRKTVRAGDLLRPEDFGK